MLNTKYIGMDVHKETVSIAILNSSGKLVMESVLETKANTMIQFVQGLRGDLRVTLEEGTWAAWLYDLLRPHVTEVVVCDPRKNALLKVGNKNDRMDARKLAELLYLNRLKPVYHGEHGVRALKELSRSYLAISGDQARVMTRIKALYRSWAIPCAGKQVYAARYRSSCDWPDPRGAVDRDSADASPVPHEAAAMGLRRTGNRDAQQCRSSVCRWAVAAIEATSLVARAQSQSQSRAEKHFQGCSHHRRHQTRAAPAVLRCVSGERNTAGDGATDTGAQDRGHHFNRLEERSLLRRRASETTNSLSVSGIRSIPWNLPGRWSVGS